MSVTVLRPPEWLGLFRVVANVTSSGEPWGWYSGQQQLGDRTDSEWVIVPEHLEDPVRVPPLGSRITSPTAGSRLAVLAPATDEQPDAMALMQLAAEQGDEVGFVRAARTVVWEKQAPEEVAQAVRWALAAGAVFTARDLATQGACQYPQDTELQKMARILAPPRVTVVDKPPDPGIALNFRWLREHADEYAGQWVAVQAGVLLAVAPTPLALKGMLPSLDGVLVTKIV